MEWAAFKSTNGTSMMALFSPLASQVEKRMIARHCSADLDSLVPLVQESSALASVMDLDSNVLKS